MKMQSDEATVGKLWLLGVILSELVVVLHSCHGKTVLCHLLKVVNYTLSLWQRTLICPQYLEPSPKKQSYIYLNQCLLTDLPTLQCTSLTRAAFLEKIVQGPKCQQLLKAAKKYFSKFIFTFSSQRFGRLDLLSVKKHLRCNIYVP